MDTERKQLLDAFRDRPDILVDLVSADNETKKAELESKREQTAALLQEKKEINRMRASWSRWLLICIVSIVSFDFLLIALLGLNIWTFEDQRLILAFIIEGLIKITGLAYIVVNYLFDKNEKNIFHE